MKGKEKKEQMKQEVESLDVIETKEKKSHEVLKKALSRTSYTIIMLAIIIAAYIGINLLVEKANILDIDVTADKVYSLSDTSKQIAKSIDKDVKIILVNDMTKIQSVINVSNRYTKENSKIVIEEMTDVSKHPEFAAKYNLANDTSKVIMQCGDRDKELTTDDLFVYDIQGQPKDITEETMTNALLDITIDKKPKIYFLSGHNANLTSYMYTFKQNLKSEANEVEDLDLLRKGGIPDDCDLLAITTLNDDLNELERDSIIKYIKKGGKIILFADANASKIKMPNFQKVLDEYGISISEGVLLEQNTDRMLYGYPSAMIVSIYQGTSITKNFNSDVTACFINAGRINFKDSETLEKLGVEVEKLATTTEKAFYRTDLSIESSSKQKGEEEGVSTVGALLTKKIDDDTTAKLIVYSNNMFVTSMPIQLSAQYYTYAYQLYDNESIALNSISYLTGREDTIMIRKDVEIIRYTVTEQQSKIILTIIFAVPALIIVAGIVVWIIRRRKK